MFIRNLGRVALGVIGALTWFSHAAQAQTFTLGSNFTGITLNDTASLGSGATPPDTMGAVGPKHVVELINGGYAVYLKDGSLIGSKVTDETFWNSAGISNGLLNVGITDPRLVYDLDSNRWFAAQITRHSTQNRILIARSDTPDPTGDWDAVSITVAADFADYPTLALDADGVYISTNNFSSGGSFTGVSLFSIPKADLLKTTPSLNSMSKFEGLSASTYGFSLQGALNFGDSIGHGAIVAVDANFFNRLDRFNVNNPGSAGATLGAETDISVASTSNPSDADQPGAANSLDGLDDRISANVQQSGDNLFMVHTISSGGKDAVRWTILSESTDTVLAEGTISEGGADLFQGSIAVNPLGDVVIAYNKSSTTEFASSYAVAGTFDGSNLTLGTPTLLKAGQATLNLISGTERWGDYAAVRLDPSNPLSFWVFNEFALSTNRWGTQITQLLVDNPNFLFGDLDFDGDVDNADVLVAIASFTGAGGSMVKTYAEGDMDGDGDVDNADMIVFISNFTGSMASSTMDALLVDANDFIPRQQALSSVVALPEPTSLSMLAMAGLWLCGRRRRD